MTAPRSRPLVVVALGGNALLQRGDSLDEATQRARAGGAARALALLADEVDLVVTHGNGPQVGLLAREQRHPAWPLDVLGAETQGMIGYVLANELDVALGASRARTLLTRVVVDAGDPAFDRPTKPVGEVYASQQELLDAADGRPWTSARDGAGWRRTVPSPEPVRIVELDAIVAVAREGLVPVCCGGGGIPVVERDGRLAGIEAVIDKDATSALLARELRADALLLLTDVDGVYEGWGSPDACRIDELVAGSIEPSTFAEGSMGPKVRAAARFAQGGGRAGIGRLEDARGIWAGAAGTIVRAAPVTSDR